MMRHCYVVLLFLSSLLPAHAISPVVWETSNVKLYVYLKGQELPFVSRWIFNLDHPIGQGKDYCNFIYPDDDLSLIPDSVSIYHVSLRCPTVMDNQMTFNFEVNTTSRKYLLLSVDRNGYRLSDAQFLDYLANSGREDFGSYDAIFRSFNDYTLVSPSGKKYGSVANLKDKQFERMGLVCSLETPHVFPTFQIDCNFLDRKENVFDYTQSGYTLNFRVLKNRYLLLESADIHPEDIQVDHAQIDHLLRRVLK